MKFLFLHAGYGRGNHKIHSAGFTLIELLVAMSLFAIVSVMSVGAVITTGEIARTSQAKRTVIDTVHFALETMSRKIKIGKNYHCDLGSAVSADTPTACPGGASSFAFLTFDQQSRIEYRLSATGEIETRTCAPAPGCGTTAFGPLTSASEVNISRLVFLTTDDVTPPADGKQPFVIILIEGQIKNKDGSKTPFTMQTYLSQRVLES